jgi:glycosyltransferase involved in cell wall biosynthesis
MSISVIVCTHNRADLLRGCLQSLVDQEFSEDVYEVVVVENACEDDTNAVLESFVKRSPRFRAVHEPQAGKSRALNAGLSRARGTHVAFIDDDARAPREWVGRLAAAFSNTAPRPAVVVGKIEPVYGRRPPPWWPTEGDDGEPGFLRRRVDLLRRVAGSNLAFDRQALLDCGGFALEHGPIGDRFRLGEDTEAVVRVAARHPHVWYDPRIAVQHWVPADKMTLRYLTRRRFLSGVAVSRIEGTRLLSFETIRAAALSARELATRRRNGAWGAEADASSQPPRWFGRAQVPLARLTLWLAAVAGRVGGARFSV